MKKINPVVKLLAILVPGLCLSLFYDWFTPLFYLPFLLLMTFGYGKIPLKKGVKIFAIFLLLSFGFGWTAALYANDGFAGGDVIFTFGWMTLTTGGLQTGLSIMFRSLCFLMMSMMFIFTTDTTQLMMSFIHQCKLPPKFAYGIIAGYRFLPVFQHEFQLLQKAHQIRGVGRLKGIKGKIHQFQRYSIPLLANGIRKAERVAIAMESKGFTGDRNRTYYHRTYVTARDWIFFAMMIGMLVVGAFISYKLGYLKIFNKQF